MEDPATGFAESKLPCTEQPEPDEIKVTAPVPDPPEVVRFAVSSPKGIDVLIMANGSWLTMLLKYKVIGAETATLYPGLADFVATTVQVLKVPGAGLPEREFPSMLHFSPETV
jgi:hypothetical protein